MVEQLTKSQADIVRHFNRFYTRQIGVLDEHLLASPFTLTQARVLFELGTHNALAAAEIGDSLRLDRGYLSRIVSEFVAQGLVSRKRSTEDSRRSHLSLTGKGKTVFRSLDRSSQRATEAMLSALPARNRMQLTQAMQSVEQMLKADSPPAEVAIRRHRTGDIGWAIELHAQVYADEFGWNEEFEALVASLFARFATEHDPDLERCCIAEVGSRRAGCVFVVRNADETSTAQLRCLLVDPVWRGLGIGGRLVDECLAFATAAGYRRMMLWTNDVLVSARKIYEARGFQLEDEERHRSFGHDLIGQTWGRELRDVPPQRD